MNQAPPTTRPCRGCGQQILWITTEAGKPMPVDPAVVTIITADGRTVRGYVPHWSTCPKAEEFKRR